MDPNEKRRSRGRARGPSQGTPTNQSGQPQQVGGPRPAQAPQSQPQRPQQFQGSRPAQAPQSQPQRPQQFQGPRPAQAPQSQPQRPQQFQGPRSAQAPQSQPQRPQQFQGPRPAQAPQSQPQRPQQFQGPRAAHASSSQPQRQQQSRGPRPAYASSSQSQVEQVTGRMKNMTTGSGVPEFVKLKTNYFPITSYTNWTLYQYQVEFQPDCEVKRINSGLLGVHQEVLGSYIFDGQMLYSSTKYQTNPNVLSSTRFDNQIISIKIRFTKVVDKESNTMIQLLNILLRKCIRSLSLQQVGRHYYDEKRKVDFPKYNLELWPGYETTIGEFDGGLLLRSEISTKIMRTDTVYDYLVKCGQDRDRSPNWMEAFKKVVLGSVVLTRYNNRTYKIHEIKEDMRITSEFCKKDGSRITYENYYKEKYQIMNLNRTQPMLLSLNNKAKDEENKLVYLVPQLCHFTGINDSLRKDFYVMKDIAYHTKLNPTARVSKYNDFIERVLNTSESKELLNKWNLTLSDKLVQLNGRILRQEMIKGNQSQCSYNYDADWSKEIQNLPMYRTVILKKWLVIFPSGNKSAVEEFISTLRNIAKKLNFDLPQPIIDEFNFNANLESLKAKLETILNTENPSFILCIIPRAREDVYCTIKKKLCNERGVLSQVVLLKNVMNRNMSVCTKIVIQINSKLNGAPWRVDIPGPVNSMMIIGYDVCHDTVNKSKSYGAFIATMDTCFTSFFSCVQQHTSGQELSTFFSVNTIKALNKFKIKNNKLPDIIIIYRDGVGDGQIEYVQKTEVEQVKEACKQIYKDQKVGLAFIIVKKRINTKFFKFKDTKHENPQPGTVVDSTVTDPSDPSNPTLYDFYLVSQHAKQGTVTPTHYKVIFNSLSLSEAMKLSPIHIQKITYKLTHLYYNWSGTIRVPAPCHLAHRLAFMAAKTLRSPVNPVLEDFLFYL
ncbi:piwi-like protein Siwi [Rhopalosiphum padi]|uniref:piwi-like protein Siwi n=1 Tax=Rhopalosiphum padi TaxID=40932 RepID=UPI00298E16F0|nr:piwi-like protein Siwi [Rhopalosiphum padi]